MMAFLFEELFHKTIQSELQEMGNNVADDALLLAVLRKSRFPLNRLRIEMMVPSYSPDCFRSDFRMS